MAQFNKTNNFLVSTISQQTKAAVFVAHPDDETIWMGGTILSHKDWEWKIFMATHNPNDDRGKQFQNAIAKYRDKVNKLSFEFIEIMPDDQNWDKINSEKALSKLSQIDLNLFDIIFTHNIDGEYKHPNHELLGKYFKEQKKNIWHFLCPAIQNPKEKQIGEYIESLYLDSGILSFKKEIFQKSYPTEDYL